MNCKVFLVPIVAFSIIFSGYSAERIYYLNYNGKTVELSQINDIPFLEVAAEAAEQEQPSFADFQSTIQLMQQGRKKEALDLFGGHLLKASAIKDRIHMLRLAATAQALYRQGKRYCWNEDDVDEKIKRIDNVDDLYVTFVAFTKQCIGWDNGVAKGIQGKTDDAELKSHLNYLFTCVYAKADAMPNSKERWRIRMQNFYLDTVRHYLAATPEEQAQTQAIIAENQRRSNQIFNNMMMSMLQQDSAFNITSSEASRPRKFQSTGYCARHQCSYIRSVGMGGGCPKCNTASYGLKSYFTCPKCHREYDSTFGHHCP